MDKHRFVEEMIAGKDYNATDIANYAIYNHDNDNDASRNIEDLINTLLDMEAEKHLKI